MIALRTGLILGVIGAGAVFASAQSAPRTCVTTVSTGGSPYRVLTPEGEEVSRHSQQHTAQASATNAAWERPGEVFRVVRSLEIRVEVDPACTTPPLNVVPPVENLAPDSVVILGDSAEISVGDTIRFPLVVWWTIPQEADLGSRPFLCFGPSGMDSQTLPPLDGWYEVVFLGGYPESIEWAIKPEGHSFTGDACMTAEAVALPPPEQSA